jgi:hypothetical protein
MSIAIALEEGKLAVGLAGAGLRAGRGGEAAEGAAAPGHRPRARQGVPDMTAGGA